MSQETHNCFLNYLSCSTALCEHICFLLTFSPSIWRQFPFSPLFHINCLLSDAGDIGGQMGLFIGASILTILELFDYLYEVKYLSQEEYLPSLSAASHLDRKKASTGVYCLWKFVPPQYYRITRSQNRVFHTILPSAQGRVLVSMTNAVSLTTPQPISV